MSEENIVFLDVDISKNGQFALINRNGFNLVSIFLIGKSAAQIAEILDTVHSVADAYEKFPVIYRFNDRGIFVNELSKILEWKKPHF